jgi:hypothetical protein
MIHLPNFLALSEPNTKGLGARSQATAVLDQVRRWGRTGNLIQKRIDCLLYLTFEMPFHLRLRLRLRLRR